MTGTAQPLANLLAFGAENPDVLHSYEQRLLASGQYATVWRPNTRWVFASRPLPGSIPDDTVVRKEGLAFAQGRTDVLSGSGNSQDILPRFSRDLREDPESLAKWPGDFACFYAAPDGGLHAARACAGLVPIYWWSTAGKTVLSTETSALICFGGWQGELDAMRAALAASYWLSSFKNSTHLKGVNQLQPGECLAIKPGGEAKIRRYWMPLSDHVPPFGPRTEREHQHELRDLLLGGLERDLNPAGGNLLSFSGGVDSSSLLALSAGKLGMPVMTLSLVPPASAASSVRELRFIRGMRERMGVRDSWEREMTIESYEAQFQGAPKIPYPVLHPALWGLPAILQTHNVNVMFGGEFADEVCGSSFSLPDWCAATPFTELLTSFRRWPKGWTTLPRWFKVKVKYLLDRPYLLFADRLPEWCQPQIKAEFDEYRRDLVRWVNFLPEIHRNLYVHHMTIDFAPMNWEVCSRFNIRRCIPFHTRRVMELAIRCHPAELVGPDTKRLLRGALVHDVPHDNLFRVDKGDFGLNLDGLERNPRLLDLGNDSIWGPLEGIVVPEWRASLLREGSVNFSDYMSLLILKALSENVRLAQSNSHHVASTH